MIPTKSKTLATWIALIGGPLGLHRFYLGSLRDSWGWVHALLTFLGVLGVQRVMELGQDDRLAWVLMPLGGLSLVVAMGTAIFHGLRADEAWNATYNADAGSSRPTGWLAVMGVVAALLIGATAMLSVISFSLQRYFELEREATRATEQATADLQ
ncbi:NINE protein [Sphaerotilus mobilis]|uniref:TM2 domain-containing protein n=1 Tax=Sphaerotilus mobilis TaxID=47994 RepID=A0A4Q7LC76_9BURK|nr:NINE protein [Sphaerotilus mobilis]RZS51976.1 TM2 domain-containing protein [Sphaerotilus mobilis]